MSYKNQLVEIGSLSALVTSGSEDARTIVLFHGYGADASDLYPLHQYIQAPKDTRWVFPEGVLDIEVTPGFGGRAWFPIDIEALERAMQSGTHRDLSTIRPPGLNEAKAKALSLLSELEKTSSQIVIGGFSQGAMLANDIVFTTDFKVSGLITLSGTLLDSKSWEEGARKRKGLRYFQSHGQTDPLLSFSAAKKLNEIYERAEMQGGFMPFIGGHEIPEHVLMEVSSFVRHIV